MKNFFLSICILLLSQYIYAQTAPTSFTGVSGSNNTTTADLCSNSAWNYSTKKLTIVTEQPGNTPYARLHLGFDQSGSNNGFTTTNGIPSNNIALDISVNLSAITSGTEIQPGVKVYYTRYTSPSFYNIRWEIDFSRAANVRMGENYYYTSRCSTGSGGSPFAAPYFFTIPMDMPTNVSVVNGTVSFTPSNARRTSVNATRIQISSSNSFNRCTGLSSPSILNTSVPQNISSYTFNLPNGTYYISIRQAAPNVNGMYSDPVSFVVCNVNFSHTTTNAMCGQSNGRISVTATGASSFQYKLDDGSWGSSSSFGNLAAGNYTVYVRDANNTACQTERSITIGTTGSAPEITQHPQDVTICSGASTTLRVTATGTGLSYQWKKDGQNIVGATQSTYTAREEGDYTCLVTGTCNTDGVESESATIIVNSAPSLPNITATPTTVDVGESVSLSHDITDQDASSAWTFQNGTPSTSTESQPQVTFSSAGQKRVTLIVRNNCGASQQATTNVQVNEVCPTIAITTQPTGGEICQGGQKILSVTATNGNIFQWKKDGQNITGATQSSYTAREEGDYTCLVTSSCDLVGIESNAATITFVNMNIVVEPTNAQCQLINGQITVAEPIGAGYSYSIDGGTNYQTSPEFIALQPRSYTVKVKNAAGCTQDSDPQEIANEGITPSVAFSSTVNGLSVQFTDNSLNGTSRLWDLGNNTTSTQENPFVTYAAPGTYTVRLTVTNGDCSGYLVRNVIVTNNTVNCTLAANARVVTQSSCGLANGVAEVTTQGGTQPIRFAWSNGATTPSVSGLQAGTYTVTATDNQSCTAVSTVVINPSTAPVASFTTQINGLSVQFTNTSNANATAYTWNLGNNTNSTQASPMITYATAGTYTVTFQITTTCGVYNTTQQITLNNNNPISCQNNLSEHDIYTGLNTSPNFGKSSYLFHNGVHYLLYSNGSTNGNPAYGTHDAKVKLATSSNGTTWNTTDILTTSIGSHSHVLAVDNNNKLHIAYVEGTVGGYYGLQNGTLVYANNVNGTWVKQNTNLGTGNGYSYNWTTPRQLLFGIDGKLRMYYTTTGWWAYGGPLYMRVLENGIWSNQILISNTNDGGADSQNNIWSFSKKSNGNGQISVYLSSGWRCTGVGCTPSYYNNIKVFTEGANYVYTQTNTIPSTRWYYENSLGNQLSVAADGKTISVNGNIIFTLPNDEYINDNCWINEQGSQVILNTSVGTRVIDINTRQSIITSVGKGIIPANGFNIVNDGTVNPRRVYAVHNTNAVRSSFTSIVRGTSVSFINNSVGATSSNWDFGNGQRSSEQNPTIQYASGGNYNVKLIVSNGTCNDTTSQQITIVCNLQAQISINRPNAAICEGDSITLRATGGTNFLWSNGETTDSIVVNSAGTYSVTVSDANNCTASATKNVTVNSRPNISISGDTSFCYGTSTTITAQGASSYLWSNNTTTPSVRLTDEGIYSVQGTATNGCTSTREFGITAIALPNVGIVSSRENGQATLNVTAENCRFQWNNNMTGSTITVPVGPIYYVTATDTLTGCQSRGSISTEILYELITNTIYCGTNTDTVYVEVRMKKRRPDIDAFSLTMQYDTTILRPLPNNIGRGNALPISANIEVLLRSDSILTYIDVSQGVIQGDSNALVIRFPFVFRTQRTPNMQTVISWDILEERIWSRATDNDQTVITVKGTNIAEIHLVKPNGQPFIRPSDKFSTLKPANGDCMLSSSVRNFNPNTGIYKARIDSFNRVTELRSKPLAQIPTGIIDANDVYLLRQLQQGNTALTQDRLLRGDVNGDASITLLDVTLLRRRVIGIVHTFPPYGRLADDFLYFNQNGNRTTNCIELPNISTECDTEKIEIRVIPVGDMDSSSNNLPILEARRLDVSLMKTQPRLFLDSCNARRTGIANEWRIPVRSSDVVRSLDLHFLNTRVSVQTMYVEPAKARVETNAIGENYYIVAYSDSAQGIQPTDTLFFLYYRTNSPNLAELGECYTVLNTDLVRTNFINCIQTSVKNYDIKKDVDIYPNPSPGLLTVNVRNLSIENAEVSIINQLGQVVLKMRLENAFSVLDLQNFADGIYFVKIQTKDENGIGSMITKVIIDK